MNLTRQQLRLLEYIQFYIDEHKVAPSFDEMKAALGLASKSGVHRLVRGLEARGHIRTLPHKARALQLVKDTRATRAMVSAGIRALDEGIGHSPATIVRNVYAAMQELKP